MSKRIRVIAAIIEKENKFLIARRKLGEQQQFKWEFPGGKLEPFETPEECLKRELKEEFGIDVTVKNYLCSSLYDYDTLSIELLAYKATINSGKFVLTDHDKIAWVYLSELSLYDLAPADIPIADYLQKFFNV